ncbi:MAG: rare lipoprotein A [Granulosicoccus sp.]|jgi:rare lipoprotein A
MNSISTVSGILRCTAVFFAVSLLGGCIATNSASEPPWVAAVAGDGPGNPRLLQNRTTVVQNLPKSRRGNPPVYRVFGESYKVMDSAEDFKEWGVASWYGRKFHGRETSSGEIYDMHLMTAAHKSLPLPTFVKVMRADTGKSVIVKVNDRGPFVGDRIIDLSYAAASELGMVDSGKVEVYVEALSTHYTDEPILDEPTLYSSEQQAALLAAEPQTVSVQASVSSDVYIQVGAFSQVPNAERMLDRVRESLDLPAGISHDRNRQLHLVQVGPMADEFMLQDAVDSLSQVGIESFTFVTVNP